ncbi:MAG: VWA domain-containing protein, partial [Halothiobacillaceae bacterium]
MHNPFLRALPIVAKALSENYGVSLEIRGAQAMTDGNRIVLPILPEDDQRAAVLARGYLDHEAGHVKHTDFSVSPGAGLEGALLNILDDVRVEQAMSRRYPGCRENLDALVRLLVAEGTLKPLQATDPPAKIVQGLVLYLLRSQVLGQQALAPLATQTRAVFDGKFPGLRSRVESLALAVKDAPDTG